MRKIRGRQTYFCALVANTVPAIYMVTTVLFCCVSPARGQAVLGARETGMGQTGVALPHSRWAIFGNPAMMDGERHSISFFGIRYYGFANITDMAAAVMIPAGAGVFGGGVHRYGDDLFNESRLRIAYKNAFQGFHYGVILNYSHVAIGGGYGSAGAIGVDVGVAAAITEVLWLGAKATNINRPSYGRTEEELPRDLSIGLSYMLSDIALFTSDLVKDVRFPVSYRAGVEVKIIENLKGRAGITINPQTFSLGFGYNSDAWGINVAVQRHENPILGLSPGFDLNIFW